jgi:hypothetical protein
MDITRIFKPMAEAGGNVLLLSSLIYSPALKMEAI